jgi:hypothetical protein
MAKKKGVFEADRKMELRMRLAAKRAADPGFRVNENLVLTDLEAGVLNKLIARVREL